MCDIENVSVSVNFGFVAVNFGFKKRTADVQCRQCRHSGCAAVAASEISDPDFVKCTPISVLISSRRGATARPDVTEPYRNLPARTDIGTVQPISVCASSRRGATAGPDVTEPYRNLPAHTDIATRQRYRGAYRGVDMRYGCIVSHSRYRPDPISAPGLRYRPADMGRVSPHPDIAGGWEVMIWAPPYRAKRCTDERRNTRPTSHDRDTLTTLQHATASYIIQHHAATPECLQLLEAMLHLGVVGYVRVVVPVRGVPHARQRRRRQRASKVHAVASVQPRNTAGAAAAAAAHATKTCGRVQRLQSGASLVQVCRAHTTRHGGYDAVLGTQALCD
jgi:hypothetical protein